MEDRQHDPAREAGEFAVDRQQTVAHQPDQVAEVPVAPREVRRVRDEDVVVCLRPEHEDDVRVEQAQREDRAVARVVLEQHLERFVREAARASEKLVSPGGNGTPERSLRRSSTITFSGLLSSIGRGPTSAMRVSVVESRWGWL